VNNQELINSVTFINYMPPGTMLHGAVGFGTPNFKTAFLIKENQSRLAMLPEDKMHIEIRSSLIIFDNVALIPLLIQINNNPSLTYQEWLNYHESGVTKQCFDYLTTQELLYILFFTGAIKPAKGLTVSNNLQIGFRMHIQQLKNMVPWSIEDFERLKLKMLIKYPATISLWNGLKRNAERM
jgi:hypothetical protein